jgi:hypothetical protein
MQNSVKIDGGPLSSLSIKDVDTGEILNNCDPESLRILPVCLYHIPPLMVKCSLFNIRAPPRFNSWNEKFVEALNHIISERSVPPFLTEFDGIISKFGLLNAFVENVSSDGRLDVTLYQNYDEHCLRCINGALIKNGFAVRCNASYSAFIHQEYYFRTEQTSAIKKIYLEPLTLTLNLNLEHNLSLHLGHGDINLKQSCFLLSNFYPFKAQIIKTLSPDHIYIRTYEQLFHLQSFTRKLSNYYLLRKNQIHKPKFEKGDMGIIVIKVKELNSAAILNSIGVTDCAVRCTVVAANIRFISVLLPDFGNEEMTISHGNLLKINIDDSLINPGMFSTIVSISINLIPTCAFSEKANFTGWSLNELQCIQSILPSGTEVCLSLLQRFCNACQEKESARFPSIDIVMYANLYLLDTPIIGLLPEQNLQERESSNVTLQFIDMKMAYLRNVTNTSYEDCDTGKCSVSERSSDTMPSEQTNAPCTCKENNQLEVKDGLQFGVPVMREDIPQCYDIGRGSRWGEYTLDSKFRYNDEKG